MGRFRKGQSGNPAGKPRGARDKRTALRTMLEPHRDALVTKAVELALAGDTTALRICIDRLMPALRPVDTTVDLQLTGTTLSEKAEQVLHSVTNGNISPDQGGALLGAISACTKIREMEVLEQRVRMLELMAQQMKTPVDAFSDGYDPCSFETT